MAKEAGFQMDQGNLVILFILLLLIGFLLMLGSSLLNPPENKLEAFTKKIERSTEKSKLRKEWDARRAKDAEEDMDLEEPSPEIALKDTFFTLGSDKAWVSHVQGPPHQNKGREWLYGYSNYPV